MNSRVHQVMQLVYEYLDTDARMKVRACFGFVAVSMEFARARCSLLKSMPGIMSSMQVHPDMMEVCIGKYQIFKQEDDIFGMYKIFCGDTAVCEDVQVPPRNPRICSLISCHWLEWSCPEYRKWLQKLIHSQWDVRYATFFQEMINLHMNKYSADTAQGRAQLQGFRQMLAFIESDIDHDQASADSCPPP